MGDVYECVSELRNEHVSLFFKECRHPGRSCIYWARVTSLTFNSQPMHLTHKLILCSQITWGRVDNSWDSAVKSPCWHWVLNLWPSNRDLLRFAAVPSLQDLAIFRAPHRCFHLGVICWKKMSMLWTLRRAACMMRTFIYRYLNLGHFLHRHQCNVYLGSICDFPSLSVSSL